MIIYVKFLKWNLFTIKVKIFNETFERLTGGF